MLLYICGIKRYRFPTCAHEDCARLVSSLIYSRSLPLWHYLCSVFREQRAKPLPGMVGVPPTHFTYLVPSGPNVLVEGYLPNNSSHPSVRYGCLSEGIDRAPIGACRSTFSRRLVISCPPFPLLTSDGSGSRFSAWSPRPVVAPPFLGGSRPRPKSAPNSKKRDAVDPSTRHARDRSRRGLVFFQVSVKFPRTDVGSILVPLDGLRFEESLEHVRTQRALDDLVFAKLVERCPERAG